MKIEIDKNESKTKYGDIIICNNKYTVDDEFEKFKQSL